MLGLDGFRLLVFFGAYGSMFAFAVLFSSALFEGRLRALEHARQTAELQRLLQEAEFKELQAQIRPHFLFNALNSIARLIYLDRSREAADGIYALSSLLRAGMGQGPDRTRLADELQLVRAYLQIQQLRFGHRLEVVLDVPDDLLSVPIPPLTLQPLVENACIHGAEGRGDGGRIEVRGRRVGGQVVLEVWDNGPGPAPGAAPGMGLANVERRLHLAFGPGCGLELAPAPAGGTWARLRLPADGGV